MSIFCCDQVRSGEDYPLVLSPYGLTLDAGGCLEYPRALLSFSQFISERADFAFKGTSHDSPSLLILRRQLCARVFDPPSDDPVQ